MSGRDPDGYGQRPWSCAAAGGQQAAVARAPAAGTQAARRGSHAGRRTGPHQRRAEWDERLGAFGAAWRWLRADARLTFLANPDAEVEVREQLAGARQGSA